MIRINADDLNKNEKKFLRHAMVYTLDYFIPRRNRKDLHITVNIRPRNIANKYEEDYEGVVNHTDNKHFQIWIYNKLIDKRGKSLKGKLSKIVSYLNHEIVHIKQYFLGEVIEVSNTHYKYKGRVYKNPRDDDLMGYFESPEELEAYGRETGLNMRFWVHWDEYVREQRARSTRV